LSDLKPDASLTNGLDNFRFSGETATTNFAAELPRSLLRAALTNAPSPAAAP
jgi:hypothetical protein